MEENKHTEKLDAFAKKYIKEIKQEQPSLDFTRSIMQTISKENTSKVIKVKALISKRAWSLIAVIVLAAIFIPLKTSEKSFINFPEINFSFMDKIQFPVFSVSNTVLYAVLFFGIMFFAQVVFLKNHFNKRYN